MPYFSSTVHSSLVLSLIVVFLSHHSTATSTLIVTICCSFFYPKYSLSIPTHDCMNLPLFISYTLSISMCLTLLGIFLSPSPPCLFIYFNSLNSILHPYFSSIVLSFFDVLTCHFPFFIRVLCRRKTPSLHKFPISFFYTHSSHISSTHTCIHDMFPPRTSLSFSTNKLLPHPPFLHI